MEKLTMIGMEALSIVERLIRINVVVLSLIFISVQVINLIV